LTRDPAGVSRWAELPDDVLNVVMRALDR
jgi:hypothetical protein